MSENKKPRVYMLGGVTLKKWEGDKFPYYNFEKRYQDAQGEWQSTNSMSRDDLLKLKSLIDKALEEEIKLF